MRILIVDDLKPNLWITNILDEKNIQYDKALSGDSAYRKLSEEKYDGIILDMQFPIHEDKKTDKDDRAGEIFLKELKNRNIEIPVIGNSMCAFPSKAEFPFLKEEKLAGFENYHSINMLYAFLESIEEQSK